MSAGNGQVLASYLKGSTATGLISQSHCACAVNTTPLAFLTCPPI